MDIVLFVELNGLVKQQKNIYSCMQHSIIVDGVKDFIVINDEDYLSDENIEPEDIEIVIMENKKITEIRSWAWSSNVKWFIIFQPTCIYVGHIYRPELVRCKKKSSKFIEMFMKANTQKYF